jgi:hypothetical protein
MLMLLIGASLVFALMNSKLTGAVLVRWNYNSRVMLAEAQIVQAIRDGKFAISVEQEHGKPVQQTGFKLAQAPAFINNPRGSLIVGHVATRPDLKKRLVLIGDEWTTLSSVSVLTTITHVWEQTTSRLQTPVGAQGAVVASLLTFERRLTLMPFQPSDEPGVVGTLTAVVEDSATTEQITFQLGIDNADQVRFIEASRQRLSPTTQPRDADRNQ